MFNKQTAAITVSDTIFCYQEGFTVAQSYLKEGILDKAGSVVIPFIYDEIECYSEGLFCASYRGKYGYLDANNEWIVEPIYDLAYSFSEGLAVVSLNDKYGFINKQNEIVIPIQYNSACSFSEELASVEDSDGQKYFINKDGQSIFIHNYNVACPFMNGLSIVTNNEELMGAIDKQGDEVMLCIYKSIKCDECSQYLIATLPNGTIDLYDWGGKKVNDLFSEYDHIGTMYPEYQSVVKDGLYGLSDQKGALIIPCVYSEELSVDTGDSLAVTSKDGLYGAISIKTQEEVIPFQYVEINSCGDDCYALSLSSRRAIVVSSTNQKLFQLNVDKSINDNFYATQIKYDELDYSLLSEKKVENLLHLQRLRTNVTDNFDFFNQMCKDVEDFNTDLILQYGIDVEQELDQ